MSDFDFDELDKAVNGAIGTDTSGDDGLIEMLDTHESNTSSAQPSQQAEQPVVAAAAKPVAPAARRSSGRFMDVVHPSSDMRPGGNDTTPVTRSAPSALVKPYTQTSTPAPSASVTPAQGVEDIPAEDWSKSLESPFLTDAKVEKRPLGGEAPTTTEFDPMQLLEEPDDPRIEAHTMPDPIDFASQSEAGEPAQEPEAASSEEVEKTIDEPAVHSEIPTHTESDDTAFGYGEGSFQPEAKDDDAPVGPTSIHQQYKEQPSSSPESGAIYDTESYHQPLAHVAKKKKPSFAILWILLILILGAGAGAAFYFYVLPML